MSNEDLFYQQEGIEYSESFEIERELSLKVAEIRQLKEDNQKIKVLEIKYMALISQNKQLCMSIIDLEKQNKKLKQKIKPNIFKRLWRKIKNNKYRVIC